MVLIAPSPDPYLEGAHGCGVSPDKCVVVEDTPPGIRAGIAAGAITIGLLTTHSREAMLAANPTYLVKDLARYYRHGSDPPTCS